MTGLYFFQIEANVDKSLKSLTDKRAEEIKVRFQFRQSFGLTSCTHNYHKICIDVQWVTCNFNLFLSVFQSFRDNERVKMRGYVLWNPLYQNHLNIAILHCFYQYFSHIKTMGG